MACAGRIPLRCAMSMSLSLPLGGGYLAPNAARRQSPASECLWKSPQPLARVERRKGPAMTHYERTTNGISVAVEPQYLDDKSRPDGGYFVWSYTVTIVNNGKRSVTRKTRYWKIVDANGRVQEVRGAGVVGEQPTLAPGGTFRYTSGAPLATPSGFMSGVYQMETEDGEPLNVDIPAFSLDSPDLPRPIH